MELGNWSIKNQLGSTNSKGLPVLFQGSHQGLFLNNDHYATLYGAMAPVIARLLSIPAPRIQAKPSQTKPSHLPPDCCCCCWSSHAPHWQLCPPSPLNRAESILPHWQIKSNDHPLALPSCQYNQCPHHGCR